MKNLLYVVIAMIAILGLLNTVGDNRDGPVLTNTVAASPPGVIVLDGRDPFFQTAGAVAVVGIVLLIALIFINGPHPKSHTSRQDAVIAAIVLGICLFALSYVTHSEQGELMTLLFDGL